MIFGLEDLIRKQKTEGRKMKRKKKVQQSLTGSLVMSSELFAEMRGLDPDILEREALSYGFGINTSGIININAASYDAWVNEEIRSGGTDLKKPSSHKKLSESNNPGVLKANIINVNDQLPIDEADREWLKKQLTESQDDLEKKQIRVYIKRLTKKIDDKIKKREAAKNRLHHLYDAELAESDNETDSEEKKNE